MHRLLTFCAFLVLFGVYDVTVWLWAKDSPHGVSLIDYIVRDERTDESAMYWPLVHEILEGKHHLADPYLIEYQRTRDIKPRIPAWLCSALAWCAGSVNLGVVLTHTLFPALAALLLVEIGVPFVGRPWAIACALLSAAGIAYAMNDLVVALRVAELSGPSKYNVVEHLYEGSGLHMEFQRFFSPGVTLAPFLLAVWWLVQDTDFKLRRTPVLVGVLVGLHPEIYLHGGVTLFVLASALLCLNIWYQLGQQSPGIALRAGAIQLTWFLGSCLVAALPWLLRYRAFSKLEYAAEIMRRVGNFDFTPDIYRLPLLAWTCLAVYLRHVAWLSRPESERLAKPAFLADGRDRVWASLVITMLIAGWLTGIAGDWGYFPCSHLICYRYLAYLAPLLVAYPSALLAKLWFSKLTGLWQRCVQTVAWTGMTLALAAIVYGEWRAATNCAHLYQVTPAMAMMRDKVLPVTPPHSVILTDNLRLASYVVCESNRNTFVGYASVSLAPTGELIDRLMIPSIIVGRSFEAFERDHYLAGYGLPQGPDGKHWVLHHHGDIAPVPRADLLQRYQGLQNLPAATLLSRYRFDFAFFVTSVPVEPYLQRLKPLPIEGLYQLVTSGERP